MDINGHSALVTGGGSGLGEATARLLAGQGAKVIVADINEDAAAQVASDIGGSSLLLDVSNSEQVISQIDNLQEQLIPRIIVNCAGVGFAARVLPRSGELSIDVFQRTIAINLGGSYNVLSAAARRLSTLEPISEDGERGVIINTSSVAYQDGQIGQPAYAASKGGIASMTLPIARELARVGIRVMAIAPGLFESAMTAGLPDETRAAISANIPFPSRLGKASEFAQLVGQIVENPSLNGEVIRLDGALRLPPK